MLSTNVGYERAARAPRSEAGWVRGDGKLQAPISPHRPPQAPIGRVRGGGETGVGARGEEQGTGWVGESGGERQRAGG